MDSVSVRCFHLGEVCVDPAVRRITSPRGAVSVEPRVMDVLVALAVRAPSPITRDELFTAVWGHAVVTDGVLTRCVSLLRQHLGDTRAAPRYIETLSKGGYRLIMPPIFATLARPPRIASGDPPRRVALAVLPFVSLSPDPADEQLADGFTDCVIASLARIAALAVTSRTSSMCFKHSHAGLQTIARQLHVSHILEGSLLHLDGQLQIGVQLIDSQTDTPRWAMTYTRETCGVLTLLNEVACSVADATSTALVPDESSGRAQHPRAGAVESEAPPVWQEMASRRR